MAKSQLRAQPLPTETRCLPSEAKVSDLLHEAGPPCRNSTVAAHHGPFGKRVVETVAPAAGALAGLWSRAIIRKWGEDWEERVAVARSGLVGLRGSGPSSSQLRRTLRSASRTRAERSETFVRVVIRIPPLARTRMEAETVAPSDTSQGRCQCCLASFCRQDGASNRRSEEAGKQCRPQRRPTMGDPARSKSRARFQKAAAGCRGSSQVALPPHPASRPSR